MLRHQSKPEGAVDESSKAGEGTQNLVSLAPTTLFVKAVYTFSYQQPKALAKIP